MPLPTLPSDTWLRILTYLPPETLSTVCEVNRELSHLATQEVLYRRYLKPDSTDLTTPSAVLYRRLEALHYPGETRMSVYSSPNKIPFCVVNKTLVILDTESAGMICFPQGYYILPAVGFENCQAVVTSLRTREMSIVYVLLPTRRFAFMHQNGGITYLSVLQEDTGTLFLHDVDGPLPVQHILPRRELLLAGENGEFIAYYKTHSSIALINWRTGAFEREIEISPEMKFVFTESCEVRGGSLVGLTSHEETESGMKLVARLFDGSVKKFDRDFEGVLRVLRSSDMKTFVVISRDQVEIDEEDGYGEYRTCFHAIREESDVSWSGELNMDEYVELRENGRLIHCAVEPFSANEEDLDMIRNKHLWIELREDGSTEYQTVARRLRGIRPIWTRRLKEGTLGIFVSMGNPTQIYVLRLMPCPGSSPPFVRLEHWVMRNVTHVWFVDEHYLVVGTKMGCLFVKHFNFFCEAQGVLACPGEVVAVDDDDDLDWTMLPSCGRKKTAVERFWW